MAATVATTVHEVQDNGTNYLAVVNVPDPGWALHRHLPERWVNVVILGAGMPCSLFADNLDELSTCRCFGDVTTVLESTRNTAGDLTNGTHAAFMVVLSHFDFSTHELHTVVDVAAVRLALVAGPAQTDVMLPAVTATYGVART